ncbi:MAG: FecR domain-containing protein [Acidimicrobiia bacterium]|nr:FecR domain-containing protein [Acidimicrobiia bacterium]
MTAALCAKGPGALAQELPPGVSPQEYTARVDNVWEVWIGLTPDGYADPDFETDSGISAEADMEYVLTFWNVGALKSGYAAATISRVYQPRNAITDIVVDDQGTNYVTIPMDLNRTVVTRAELSFSGGPEGTFSGTSPETGKRILGHIEPPAGGLPWSVVFTEGIQQRYLITTPEPFAGWPRCTGGGDSGARFSSISRIVEVFPDADPDAIISAKPSTVLNVCDHVVTGEESSAVISFSDLSTILMRAEAEVVIVAPPSESRGGTLEALGGRIMMNIQKVLSGEPIEVKTNWATVGIKGTTLVIEVSAGGEVVKVIEGAVEVTGLATGDTVLVSGGETVTATAQGISVAAPFDAAAEAALWEEDFGVGAEPGTEPGGGSSLLILLLIGGFVLVAAAGGGVAFWRARARAAAVEPPPPLA